MSILRLGIQIKYAQYYKGLCMEEKCQFIIYIKIYIGHFMGDLQSKFFFDETFFLPFYFANNGHVFFFQFDTWKFRDIIFLSLALGKKFFFPTAHCKSSFEYKM